MFLTQGCGRDHYKVVADLCLLLRSSGPSQPLAVTSLVLSWLSHNSVFYSPCKTGAESTNLIVLRYKRMPSTKPGSQEHLNSQQFLPTH